MITAKTSLCLVIGDPVEHSLSPIMHNAAFEAAGIAGQYCFCAARVAPEELQSAVSGFRALNIRGISVTLPHKGTVIPFLDTVDELARKAGAVNTIVNTDGKLIGYNTDIDGIILPIDKCTTIAGKQAAVIGAGGAARAAVYGLLDAGASVAIINRSAERGQSLAQEAGTDYLPLSDADRLQDFDIIVQTTPVGMDPNIGASPIPDYVFRKGQIVLDAVYNPLETQFLKDAKAAGATSISGIEMFITQGARQFTLYTGFEAPVGIMRSIVEDFFGE